MKKPVPTPEAHAARLARTLETLPRVYGGRRCGVCLLPEPVRRVVEQAFPGDRAARRVSARQVSDCLREDGYNIAEAALHKHAAGQCIGRRATR